MSKKDQKAQRHGQKRDNSARKSSKESRRELAPKKSPAPLAPQPARNPAKHPSDSRPERRPQRPASHDATDLWLFGKHPVMAALQNPARPIKRLFVTKRSAEQYKEELYSIMEDRPELSPEIVPIEALMKPLPDECVHQGIALQTAPLPAVALQDCCAITEDGSHLVLILDQITDPHNVGAIIRSAAAFGARAIISTDRNAPPESGTLAKSSSGALEVLPWVRVTNLSRALDELADMGYWRLGMDGAADLSIRDADFGQNIALVMGAEGKGLRKGTVSHCDALIKLPIQRTVESLNVSNAAAIALYAFSAS
ncbi:23S rRNA (guanosine(2251)-2'-O)-methyltransferase RlmB [Paremcibacter congregatus]|uniref:23S rRNA (guanosine(2251)-2'-O)-methyltransferase RlmB n=1 Tax=Paremcibacter congregatus TaxID=2043170 RepID=UPI0030ECCBB0|tara:strand:+ start:551 stop:1483 length:933 start_codon:yes stop_codon:yes gene_type:complete